LTAIIIEPFNFYTLSDIITRKPVEKSINDYWLLNSMVDFYYGDPGL